MLAGQAAYTKPVLAAYDFLVLGFSNRLVWNCPAHRLEAHYNRHISANHLDVGVGTGYFLDRCRFPTPTPRLALEALNENALAFTARRLARYRPDVYRRNALTPITLDAARFDSVGMNDLLHCLPALFDQRPSSSIT